MTWTFSGAMPISRKDRFATVDGTVMASAVA